MGKVTARARKISVIPLARRWLVAAHEKRSWRPSQESTRRPSAAPPAPVARSLGTANGWTDESSLGLLSSPPFGFMDRSALVLVVYPPRGR